MIVHVKVVNIVLKVFQWFWNSSCIIMLIPGNFCITCGFTSVTWTTRTISFLEYYKPIRIYRNYNPFISIILIFLKLINYTVNEIWLVISLHGLLFYQRNFFIKAWWNSSWNSFTFTMDLSLNKIQSMAIFIVHK